MVDAGGSLTFGLFWLLPARPPAPAPAVRPRSAASPECEPSPAAPPLRQSACGQGTVKFTPGEEVIDALQAAGRTGERKQEEVVEMLKKETGVSSSGLLCSYLCCTVSSVRSFSSISPGFNFSASSRRLQSNSAQGGISPTDLHTHTHTVHSIITLWGGLAWFAWWTSKRN